MTGAVLWAALLGALATGLMAAAARGLGWIDRRDGLEDRKPREQPVPVVGGAAILAAAALARWFTQGGGGLGELPWTALCGAFLLGLADDVLPGGLRAKHKLLGQLLVGLLLAIEQSAPIGDVEPLHAVALGLLAVVSMNAINTWDHADGLTGGLSAVALATGAPGLAAAVAGYLPFNTFLRQPAAGAGPGEGDRSTGAPCAMLGDSGSHLLGVALVAVPGAAWFLVLPLLDLARVARARIRRGQPFWVGDRTHLGHRLEALGLHPVAGAAVAVLAASTPLGAILFSTKPTALALALAAAGGLYIALVALTGEERRRRAGA
ncbi:MAG: hypothetical protein VX015_15225 [Planctomycetota bacterium]|nr:hypothetical protein [Planctomycetota bacterium]